MAFSSAFRLSSRLGALTQLSSALGTATSEGQLSEAVASAVRALFGPDANTTLYLDIGGELVSSVDGHSIVAAFEGRGFQRPQLFSARPGVGWRMLAPMIVRGGLFGVLVVERPAPELTVPDLETLVGIAGQYGFALFELRRNITQRRLELTTDLEEARAVQRRFLPSLPPRVGPLEVAVSYRPAHDVGGDFYELVTDRRGRVIVVIGDVSGCGVAAALIMSRISAELHRISPTAGSPSAVLDALNAFAMQTLPDHGFVTVECLMIDPLDQSATVANAGHVPVLLRRASGVVEVHGEDAGVPLGFVAQGSWNEERFRLRERDVLLLSTDGVVEGMNLDRMPTGLKQIASLLEHLPPDVNAINRAVLEALDASPQQHHDDVTLLSLRLAPLREELWRT